MVSASPISTSLPAFTTTWEPSTHLHFDEIYSSAVGRPGQASRGLSLARLGRTEEALANRESFGDIASDEDESGALILITLLETSILARDRDLTAVLARRLAPLSNRLGEVTTGAGGEISVGRLLGEASASLDQPSEALAFYSQGLEICEKVRFRPDDRSYPSRPRRTITGALPARARRGHRAPGLRYRGTARHEDATGAGARAAPPRAAEGVAMTNERVQRRNKSQLLTLMSSTSQPLYPLLPASTESKTNRIWATPAVGAKLTLALVHAFSLVFVLSSLQTVLQLTPPL